MPRRIVIDATPLLYTQSGIGRTTRMLIQSIAAVPSAFEILLFGRKLAGPALGSRGLPYRTRHLRLPRASEWLIQRGHLVELLCQGDLYHATDFYMPLAAVEKVVATIHDVIFLAQPEEMVDHRRLARWVPDFARRCRHIVTNSEFSKRDIVKHLGVAPDKIDVVYPGVDRELFRATDEDGQRADETRRPYFLAVSCSTSRKNTPFLLDAYVSLLRNHPQNDLVLAWSPPPEIRRRYATGAVADRIHFIGHQSEEALAKLYRGATALVYPSHYEGFGLPVLEAMSCGTPVVVSKTSALPEVGGEAAVYIDPSDRASLVGALERFENDDSLRATLKERGLAQASKFSWARCAKETLDVYERCFRA